MCDWTTLPDGRLRCKICRVAIRLPSGVTTALRRCTPTQTQLLKAPTPQPKPKPQPVSTMLDDSEWLAILPCLHRTEQLEPGSATCCGGAVNLYPVYGCNQRAKCAALTYHNCQKEVSCYTCPDRTTINPTTGQPEKQPKPAPETLPKPPGPITATGTCHICQQTTSITFCRYCGHWLCTACSINWLARGWAALKEQLGFNRPNCCGPAKPE